MKLKTSFQSFVFLTSLFLVAASYAHGQEPGLVSYSCNPATCLNYATGTGYFSNSMAITGVFHDPSADITLTRSANRTIASNGCQVSTTLTAYAETVHEDPDGDGILAHVDGEQNGVQLAFSERYRYMYVFETVKNPASGVTPCL